MTDLTTELLRVEVSGAIARLTQVLTQDYQPPAPQGVENVGGSDMNVWFRDSGVLVLTSVDDEGVPAVFMQGKMPAHAWLMDRTDFALLRPAEAIALGNALVTAGLAATVGNVTPIRQPRHTGGNGEDCPICRYENLPYPFLCKGGPE